MIESGKHVIGRMLLLTTMAATIALAIVLVLYWHALWAEPPAKMSLVPMPRVRPPKRFRQSSALPCSINRDRYLICASSMVTGRR